MAADLIPNNSPDIPGGPSTIPGAPTSTPRVGSLRAPAVQLRAMNGRWTKGGYGWEWHNLPAFFDLPKNFQKALFDSIEAHLNALSDEIQQYAQDNAPWQDQTGDARRGLKSIVIRRGEDQWEVDLGGSVDYQAFLENYDGGRLAIIQPTLREFAPRVLDIQDSFRAAAAADIVGGDQ